jgi:chromosomal replication initiation ATPase DnaA
VILVHTIIAATAKHYGIPVETMWEPRGRGANSRERAWPRQQAIYLATRLTKHSYVRIGQFFHRDHSTVLNAMHRTEQRLLSNSEVLVAVRQIARRLLAAEAGQ